MDVPSPDPSVAVIPVNPIEAVVSPIGPQSGIEGMVSPIGAPAQSASAVSNLAQSINGAGLSILGLGIGVYLVTKFFKKAYKELLGDIL